MTDTPSIESLRMQWIDAFNSRDLDRHVRLYTEDAMLFGSDPVLYRGHEGVRTYFGALGPGACVRNYPEPAVVSLLDDVALTAGFVDFAEGGRLLPYRLTWTLVRRQGNWRIAQHHGSPRTGHAEDSKDRS